MRRRIIVLFIATVILSVSAGSQKKNGGSIAGTLLDARTGMPIPEAVITLQSASFKGEKYAVTDSVGTYRLTNLPAGIYRISFEMEGYSPFIKDSVVVSPGSALAMNYQLQKEKRKRRS